jgi:hypothetical protein
VATTVASAPATLFLDVTEKIVDKVLPEIDAEHSKERAAEAPWERAKLLAKEIPERVQLGIKEVPQNERLVASYFVGLLGRMLDSELGMERLKDGFQIRVYAPIREVIQYFRTC